MSAPESFALALLLAGSAGLLAVLANRLTRWLKIPVPLLVLAAAALAANLVPSLPVPDEHTVEEVVTVALVLILFDGGMHIGWSRIRGALVPVVVVGVLGTFGTAAGGAVALHTLVGLSWFAALLVATAVAPTDPAVVFSVLGQREVEGHSGTILEGESGANDPVGIALMVSLLAAGTLDASAIGGVTGTFALQMVIGGVIGLGAGRLLLTFIRRVSLPSEGLYPLRTLLSAFVIFGVATVAQGSGFLAVFVAGIVLGDGRAPFKREIERFHSALAGLAEIVAFVLLGLTIDLAVLGRSDVWGPGLLLGVGLTLVIRPLVVGLCLLPSRLRWAERAFVLFAGLKGAVPILLGVLMLNAHTPDAERLYGIVVVVVVFSVVVQGSLVPSVAGWLRIPMRQRPPQPYAVGLRVNNQPEGAHRFQVVEGSPAAGRTVDDASDLVGNIWVSLVVRGGSVLPVRPDLILQPGDEVVILGDPELEGPLTATFAEPETRAPA